MKGRGLLRGKWWSGGDCDVRPKTRARGSTLTEFAFILPLLVTGIFGVIDFGRALYTYHFVSDAAREASRWASVRGKQCTAFTDACPAQLPVDVQTYVTSIVPPAIDSNPATLIVTAAWVAPPGNVGDCTLFPNDAGCAVQVQITYKFKFILPFLPTSTYSMSSSSEMVISQ